MQPSPSNNDKYYNMKPFLLSNLLVHKTRAYTLRPVTVPLAAYQEPDVQRLLEASTDHQLNTGLLPNIVASLETFVGHAMQTCSE